MVRSRRPLRRRLMVAAVFCCSMLLLRHNGGGALAQRDGGGDDDDDNNDDDDSNDDGTDDDDSTDNNDNTSSPTGVPTSEDDVSSEYPDCPGYATHLKDGYCDSDLNIASCGWDGGDCCQCTCGQGLDSADELPHPCGQLGDGYDCQDPDVSADCGVTPSPAASFGYPDCEGYMYSFQNSYCNYDLNNADCGWDGGDCCRCTCREYNYGGYGYTACGYYEYDCLDPEAPTDCDTDSPTPSPAEGSGYPGCEGYIYSIGDGYCESQNNNEECGWDGGDCCICECDGYGCGFYAYDCQDPTASTDCATPSPAFTTMDDGTSGYYSTSCSWSGDGMCDGSRNNEDCDWDGGDCCSCDCEDTASYECGVTGFNCLDPSSDCYGTSSSYAGGYYTYTSYFTDDQTGGDSGWYHDDDVTSNSPGYDSIDDDVVDDGNGDDYGDRDFSDSTAAGVQDIAGSNSGSSFSGIETVSVFVLSVSAFILFGCAALAALGFLRPRWCCWPGSKESASAAAAAAAAAPPFSKRQKSFTRVQPSPHSPAAAAEAAEDWALAAALRNSSAAAPAGDIEAHADEQSVVGAQESKYADEAELAGTFYSTGGTGRSQASSQEEGGGGATAGDDNETGSEVVRGEERDTSTATVAGSGNGDGVATEGKEEGGVGQETDGGTVEDEAGEKQTDDDCAVAKGEGEKQIEQGSAVEDEAEEKETTTADNPEADGAAADEKGS